MTLCARCADPSYKDWTGDDPKCAFTDGGHFSHNNWNCGTVTLIRNICYEGQELPDDISYQYCDDMKYAVINLTTRATEWSLGMALWVSWYKSRGRTDAMWLLNSDGEPRLPTEQDCLNIAAMFVRKDE